MSEQNTEFDPMDRNQDGKVSVKERLQEAADKAIEAAEIAAGVIKDEAMELYGKVKDYQTLSPEEKFEVFQLLRRETFALGEQIAAFLRMPVKTERF